MHSYMPEIVGIIFIGVAAQWLAWKLRIPSILLLLLAGFFAGPISGFIHPDKLMGPLLFPFVSISVALILFEGGLSLKIADLENVGKAVRNLIVIGIPVTFILSTAAAWWFLDLSPSMAALIGAILVVTGPTVIVPILRSIRISDRVGSVLKWEAMLNDPVGAILAVLVFEATLAGGLSAATNVTLIMLLKSVATGVGFGLIASWIMIFLLKRYMIPDFLHNSFALAMVVTTFYLSNHIQAESGLISVTMAGIFLANQKRIPVKHIVEFKENLRVLLIATLFVILAARLQVRYVTEIGWEEIGFIVFLVLICRPAAVVLSTFRSGMSWQEKVYLSWMAPRGIVAAAVSSIFALKLEAAGFPGAERIVAIVFLVIVSTVILYGLSSPWLARILEISRPNPEGVLILGAHSWAQKIARALQDEGIPVLLVDTNSTNIYEAHLALLPAVRGNILSDEVVEDLDLTGIGKLLALTPNDDVNSLASVHMIDVFERSEVYQLQADDHLRKKDSKGASKRAHGRYLFQKGLTYDLISALFQREGAVRKITLSKDYDYAAFKKEYQGKALVLFIVTETGALKVMTASDAPEPKPGQTLIVLTHHPQA